MYVYMYVCIYIYIYTYFREAPVLRRHGDVRGRQLGAPISYLSARCLYVCMFVYVIAVIYIYIYTYIHYIIYIYIYICFGCRGCNARAEVRIFLCEVSQLFGASQEGALFSCFAERGYNHMHTSSRAPLRQALVCVG